MSKSALIIGITGQDGSYLAYKLLKKGYKILGTSRNRIININSGIFKLKIEKYIKFYEIEPSNFEEIFNLIKSINPDEIFNMSGETSVATSFINPQRCINSISTVTLNILESIRIINKNIKLFSAGSSECFGNVKDDYANEKTPFMPRSPYGCAKAAAFWNVVNYRESYDIFAVTGILANHESPFRNDNFVTQKIIKSVKRIELDNSEILKLGNINVKRDWGWAPEYVDAIILMMNNNIPKDYVIASGNSHGLTEFISKAFEMASLIPDKFIVFDKSLKRPSDLESIFLDPKLIETDLGWKAKTDLSLIVEKMYLGHYF
tara:strand:+ start:395 stop:1351 length:957 start_codon:yes stop_codon:yes gene_type:complete